jgi:hypothetical protein
MVSAMQNQLLQIFVPALIGVVLGYLINQLPPLRAFRGSKFLIVSLTLETALLAGIWTWLTGDAAKNSAERGVIEKIGEVLLAAWSMALFQLIFSSWQNGRSSQSASPQLSSNPTTVIKKTRMRGKGNKARVTQSNTWVEDTNIDGDDQEFFVGEDPNPPSSGKK